MTTDKISRRTLAGLAAAGSACRSSPRAAATTPTPPPTRAAPPPRSPASSSDSTERPGETTRSSAPGGGDALAATSDIAVGGGAIFADEKVVVTQPTEGDFKCFTAICTHQGCLVVERLRRHDQLRLPRQQVLHRERRRRGGPGHVPARRGADHRRGRLDQPGLSNGVGLSCGAVSPAPGCRRSMCARRRSAPRPPGSAGTMSFFPAPYS